ncbi:hypothetical protein [Nocardia bovistercoris]|uniref:GH18 domain-containing protein n=1 Tax=Nocardia bovistercoris TaxID=2785916 RepID=A0A931IJN3_9NOCA|nr:hypothetical protein [Nocardia bovistercoris]MBH0780895.1 hypothetical protein [Nocardia bovistercoris]
MKTFLAAALAAVLLAAPAPAHAEAPADTGRLMFWVGEEMHGSSGLAGYGLPKPEDYWDLPRDQSVYTPELWDVLERNHTPLGFNLRYRRDFGPIPAGRPQRDEVLPFMREAARRHIPVKALIQIPYSDGYWSNEDNSAIVAEAVDEFDRWAHDHELRFTDVSLDLESSIQDTDAIFRIGTDPANALGTLARNAGPRHQCAAAEEYRQIVRDLRGRGYDVTASVYPYTIDDALDGMAAFSDFFDMPLIGQDEYDGLLFMTMRTVYIQANGADPGPSLQLDYGNDIRALYGDEGGITLGEAGVGPYKDVDVMATDVRAAVSAVDGPVGLYSLEKSVKAYGVAGVERLIRAGERPLSAAERTALGRPSAELLLARAQLRAIDAAAVVATPPAAAANGDGPALPNAFWGPCPR